MNEVEKRRNKARMIVNYKKFNQFIKTDNYFLPNKEILINLVKNTSQSLIVNLDFAKSKWKKIV